MVSGQIESGPDRPYGNRRVVGLYGYQVKRFFEDWYSDTSDALVVRIPEEVVVRVAFDTAKYLVKKSGG